jgi:hypothetical protein
VNIVGLFNHVSTGWSYGPTVALRAREYLSGVQHRKTSSTAKYLHPR